MKAKNKIVKFLCVVVFAGMLLSLFAGCAPDLSNSVSKLPDAEKKKVEEVYYDSWSGYQITWYDENGGVEEDGVWRYVGTYGDCYAFLRIDDNFMPLDCIPPIPVANPYPLDGLTRDVYYHTEAFVVLYHTKKDFTVMVGDCEYSGRLESLGAIENREEWISDKQLERLTKDIEEIAKEHN